MSSSIAQVLLCQLHLNHRITLGLLLIEITIMCAKSMLDVLNESSVFKVWCDNIGDVERADVRVLDDVITVCDGYKQCDLFTILR